MVSFLKDAVEQQGQLMNYKDILKKLKVADANERNNNRWTNKYVALPYKKNTLPGKTVEIRLRFLPDLVEAEKTGEIGETYRYLSVRE